MKFFGVLVFASIAGCCLAITEEEFVAEINEKANGLWTARTTGIKEENVKKLLGAWKDPSRSTLPIKKYEDDGNEIPKEFDARTKWQDCNSIGLISDQAACGSCWAMGAAGAMSDRLCIHKNQQVLVSPFALMTCCQACGNGCDGGYPSAAWQYWQDAGIVSGGLYGDNSTCQPYGLPHCDHHCTGKYPPCGGIVPTPPCNKQCVNGKAYDQDKTYGGDVYQIDSKVEALQQEIMKNGPIEVAFTVYADFEKYSSGIYKHVSGAELGGHAVRMIGWGEDNGTPYWLIANSWNEDWGEKGLFRILRGSDECGIEDEGVAALPKP